MALIKSKTLANGAAGNYWKIVSLRIDKMSKVIDVDMKLFKDESHKNGIPLGGDKKFQFQCTNEELLGDVVQLAYEKIKLRAAEMVPVNTLQPDGQMKRCDEDLYQAVDG